jgi:hypothetical protein
MRRKLRTLISSLRRLQQLIKNSSSSCALPSRTRVFGFSFVLGTLLNLTETQLDERHEMSRPRTTHDARSRRQSRAGRRSWRGKRRSRLREANKRGHHRRTCRRRSKQASQSIPLMNPDHEAEHRTSKHFHRYQTSPLNLQRWDPSPPRLRTKSTPLHSQSLQDQQNFIKTTEVFKPLPPPKLPIKCRSSRSDVRQRRRSAAPSPEPELGRQNWERSPIL